MVLAMLVLLVQAPPVDLEKLSAAARQPEANYYHRGAMQPACSPAELERLQASTSSIVGQGSGRAWMIAETMLCGSSHASMQYLLRHMPARVRHQQYPADASGGVTTELKDRRAIKPLLGLAWEVTVAGGSDRLVYGYSLGGVCGGSFELRKVRHSWLLVGLSEACD